MECSPPCQGGGRGFKSRRPRKTESPARVIVGQVAQLVEHGTENAGVGSSILPLATPLKPVPCLRAGAKETEDAKGRALCALEAR